MRPLFVLLALLVAAPLSLTGVDAIAACPRPCQPGGDITVTGGVNYFFGVTIKQDLPNTVPSIQGTLMNGCTFTAVTNQGTVTCSPPVPPPAPGTYWTCDSPGLIVTAKTGTVSGTTQCNGGPAVSATASNPGVASMWNIAIGTWGFAWTCQADFTALLATGSVLCDEPDPPVQFW